jgi:hypothetical protein
MLLPLEVKVEKCLIRVCSYVQFYTRLASRLSQVFVSSPEKILVFSQKLLRKGTCMMALLPSMPVVFNLGYANISYINQNETQEPL